MRSTKFDSLLCSDLTTERFHIDIDIHIKHIYYKHHDYIWEPKIVLKKPKILG